MRSLTAPRRAAWAGALSRAGLGGALRPLFGGGGTILMFHRVRTPDFHAAANRQNCVPAAQLRTALGYFAEAGIDVVSLDEAALRHRAADRRRFVCLGFDDGYRDNHDALLPIVQAHGVPVTIYVTPGLIDGTAPLWWYGLEAAIWQAPTIQLPLDQDAPLAAGTPAEKARAFAAAAAFILRTNGGVAVAAALTARYGIDFARLARQHMMDWDAVRAMAACKLVEIGAHSMTHPVLARLSPAAARCEMADSRDRLAAETGRPIHHFAFPFGTPSAAGPREGALAASLGFRSAVTSCAGHLCGRHPVCAHAWPRIGVGPTDSPATLGLKLAGAVVLRERLARYRARMHTTP